MTMAGEHDVQRMGNRVAPSAGAVTDTSLPTRRSVIREGVKLAFAAPVISTFLAEDALAYNLSCYPQGHTCKDDGSDPEPCCNTLTCNGNPGTCEP